MTRKKEVIKAWLEIFLLVAGVFAFAYIIKNNDGKEVYVEIKKNIWLGILKLAVKMFFNEKTLASALEGSDLQNGVGTCVEGKDGSKCQQYPLSECDSKCKSGCYPATRENVPGCKPGTCYDSSVGTCQERAIESECIKGGGKWLDDPSGNVAECQKACCIVGEQVKPLVTAQECTYIEKTMGVKTEYKAGIRNELACWALAGQKAEGACVIGQDDAKKCRFITKSECLGVKGQFYEGYLCTNPELGMNYKRTASARCVEGKDEIYWFDSEGNRENIYDIDSVKSWNNGKVLEKSSSCELGNAANPLKNQKSCGNCNRLMGSVCGAKTGDEKIAGIDFVCRDMRCIDKNGNPRENGESWCEYQSFVGVDKGSGELERAINVPGSSHFRVTCVDGEVQASRCGTGDRNSICIEEKAKRDDGKEISNAACVTNLWQLCVSYNSDIKGEGEERQRSIDERNKKCSENPLCLLKKIDIADKFKFDMCVPRYPAGFDLQKNAEGGELSCAFANQKCTVIKVKEIGGWKVAVNEGCLKPKFAEQMNDLCMSLGDCGASVNYMGELTENYKVYKSPELGDSYLDKIKKYADVKKGQYIPVGNITAYFDAIGGIERLGGSFKDPTPGGLQIAGMISGAAGAIALYVVSHTAVSTTATATTPAIAGIGATTAAVGGALAGAAIAFAVVSLLIQLTGIGAGLDPAITWTLIGAGTLAGAAIGAAFAANLAGYGSFFAILGGAGPIGIAVLAVVIIVIVIFMALGIGETKKIIVEFQCQPWQPPLGGAGCGKCGTDGYTCSKYACQSLGQTCKLLNEGTGEEKCADVSPNDISSPIIKPWKESLSSGYKYEGENERGVKIVNEENDGCIPAYTNVLFGIELNEAGYCRFSTEKTKNFDEMKYDFGQRNLFLNNHTQLLSMPDLTSLGVSGYDPNRRAEFNFYVRCIDGNGNGRDSAEYAINFCVKPGKDISGARVTLREPEKEYVKYNATKVDGAITLSEPATCKWSLNADKKYEQMENKMYCMNNVTDRNSLFGYKCSSTFPIEKDENKYYIQCKDQPWYASDWEGEKPIPSGDESMRNEMSSTYEFVIKRTKTELKIDSIKPNNETFKFGVEPATVNLEVSTSGGVDGKATCKLFGSNMGETFGVKHKQVFNQIYMGEYEFPVICEDEAGNTASAISKFKVEIDNEPPVVTRVYGQGGDLVIVTNEEGECAFKKGVSEEECGFGFANGTLMDGGEFKHTTSLDRDIYYIKCKDKYGKMDGGCSVVVKGGGIE